MCVVESSWWYVLDCAVEGITDDTGIELVEEVDVVEIFLEWTMDVDGTKEVPEDSDEVDGIGEGDTWWCVLLCVVE